MATRATFGKDPMADRQATMRALKSFKGAEFKSRQFKENKPKTEIDPTYSPKGTGTQKQ